MDENVMLRGRLDALVEVEPSSGATVEEDLARGRRALRRRRVMTGISGGLGAAVVATGVVVMVPGTASTPAPPAVASAPTTDAEAPPAPDPALPEVGDEFPYVATRQALFGAALEHFDPDGARLGYGSQGLGTTGGAAGFGVSIKLDWTNPGETGLGLVEVGVSTPGADVEAVAINSGCDTSLDCVETAVPGTEDTALVAGPDADSGRKFAVVYERPDGSVVSVAAYTLFGNNSLEPVSDVGIELAQAFEFVTDAGIRVHPDDAAGDGAGPMGLGGEDT